jgi:hypothetical protein
MTISTECPTILPDCFEEETGMTFQVAIVGSDGLIVGSDRKVSFMSPKSGSKADWQSVSSPKFVKREDDSVVCFNAGGSRSRSIARAIIDRADATESLVSRWENSLIAIADSLPAENSFNDEVLVIRKNVPDVALISVARVSNAAQVLMIVDRMCTGVAVTARFLTQHFWKPAPVVTLKRLALLTLDYAAREQPNSVGNGFDVLTVTHTGAHWENYSANDERIEQVRQAFQFAALEVIYPSNSAIDHT